MDLEKDNLNNIYKLIYIFLDNKVTVKDLNNLDICEILSTFYLIQKVILNINDKIENIFFEKVEKEKSAFDEYDKENGYEDNKEDETNIYDIYLNVLNGLFKVSKKAFGNSLKDSLDMDINELLDYFKYYIENLDEENNYEDYAYV